MNSDRLVQIHSDIVDSIDNLVNINGGDLEPYYNILYYCTRPVRLLYHYIRQVELQQAGLATHDVDGPKHLMPDGDRAFELCLKLALQQGSVGELPQLTLHEDDFK